MFLYNLFHLNTHIHTCHFYSKFLKNVITLYIVQCTHLMLKKKKVSSMCLGELGSLSP